jgi:hypothetical protein
MTEAESMAARGALQEAEQQNDTVRAEAVHRRAAAVKTRSGAGLGLGLGLGLE